MYKLTVVSGPNRGSSYPAPNGQLSFGRQAGNSIVLPSSKVSKQHCVLEINGDELVLKDQGSSNGTFVNGVLTKVRKIVPGDRIGVGEYIFEVSKPVQRPSVAPLAGNQMRMSNTGKSSPALSGLPGISFPPSGMTGGVAGMNSALGNASAQNAAPKDLKSKILFAFDHQFMPIFYGMNLKYEWRMICAGMMALFVLGNLIISVYPLMESTRSTIIQETKRRALFMAREIAERNSPYLAAKAETKTEIGSVESADGVRVALLTDLESRILAPGIKMNQYLTSGPEAVSAVQAREAFRSGRETGFAKEADPTTVVAIEPVKILNPALGKNVIVAMAIVSVDTSLFTPDLGEMAVTYSQTLILTGIFAALIMIILHQLTLKPLIVLNEDMDKALKGDLPQVTHAYQFAELNSLWEIINSAIQRVPKGQAGGEGFGGASAGPGIDEYVGPLRAFGNLIKGGLVVFDSEKKIVHMNPLFEEISGIRLDNAIGHDISEVARDQAMGSFTADILGRVSAGDDGLSEDFEISGMPYKMHVCSFGQMGGTGRCYVMLAMRPEE